MGYASYTAAVAEVSVKGEEVKVHRLVLATNCGHAVNPQQIPAQVQGTAAYAFATLHSQPSFATGCLVTTNFHTHTNPPLLLMSTRERLHASPLPPPGAGSGVWWALKTRSGGWAN